MAGFYSLDIKEVIRVKVKKCEGLKQPEYRKFSIDPQITSFEMLHGILGNAFETKSDYTLNYLAKNVQGKEVYLSMLSDWDMDAAFQCASDPCLRLRMDVKTTEQEMDDWDVIAPAEVPNHSVLRLMEKPSLLGTITSNISSHVGKTVSSMQKAMRLKNTDEMYKPVKLPMSDKEFHTYLDSAGFMVRPKEFRLSIYQGGIEPSLRRVAWRHLLCIFPENLSGRERFSFLKRKEREYCRLRDEWKERFSRGATTDEVKHIALMVKKDVLRTDRTHRMYAGGDDNKNVMSLFNILVTYALTHPDVSYCQGMSDLASPLLVIQKEEAQAYVCFCSLMSRLHGNFSPDGMAMMTQFRHLADLLQVHDPAFYDYLKSINAHDLFFCYRWLLLQLKREFPFEDALYMLEVMWSTLPLTQPKDDLLLADPNYSVKLLSSSPASPSFSFQQSVYTKLLAMRFSNRARDLATESFSSQDTDTPEEPSRDTESSQGSAFDVSLSDDDQVSDYPRIEDDVTRSLQQRSDCIDQVLQENKPTDSPIEHNGLCQETPDIDADLEGHLKDMPAGTPDTASHKDIEESTDTDNSFVNVSIEVGTADLSSAAAPSCDDGSSFQDVDREGVFTLSLESEPASSEGPAKTEGDDEGYSGLSGNRKRRSVSSANPPVDNITQSADYNCSATDPGSSDQPFRRGHSDSGVSEGSWSGGQQTQGDRSDARSQQPESSLPPPHQFGRGNPFLMFMCLTLLLQHRERIVSARMEYEDVAMFFDKMVRQHNVHKALHQARELYTNYLHLQKGLEDLKDFQLSL
ncbi:TBC1 domain family member 25-like isoform X2 [Babylonia areolata]|uniref:TBC1 domain family member 25-like isoform X2 n=1 Tax=Babylonia areolata TaxID=304850 RepID=UPI003FD63479